MNGFKEQSSYKVVEMIGNSRLCEPDGNGPVAHGSRDPSEQERSIEIQCRLGADMLDTTFPVGS